MIRPSLSAVLLLMLAFSTLNAQNGKNNGVLNAEQIIDAYKPALVSIWMRDMNFYVYETNSYKDTTILNGSGFIVTSDGLVCTNYHVVEQIDSLIVKTSDGEYHGAELVVADEKNDFAILKLNGTGKEFPTIKLGNSGELRQGQEVFAIGSPLGFEYTISSGIVAALRENEKVTFLDPVTYMNEEKTFRSVIQITAAISPGNSGGALFNNKGEVVGITTYTYTGYGNLNFAVAIDPYKDIIKIVETTDIENDETILARKEETLFNSTYNIASSLKTQLVYDWFFTKQMDTMTVIDTFVVKQDSINKTRFDKSEKSYMKCIDMRPDSFYLYQELLDLYVLTDNFSKAEGFYGNIMEKFNSDSLLNQLSSSLASAYSTSKDYDKALIFYQKMFSQDTTQTFIRYQIANAYQLKNDKRKAISEYRRLIAVDPKYIDAYIQLGKIYYESGNFERAGSYLETAYELSMDGDFYASDLPSVYFYRGMIAAKEGREMDALLSYLELKSSYDYSGTSKEKKLELYKELKKLGK